MLNIIGTAEKLGVHFNTVYSLIKAGKLKAYRFGKRKFFVKEEDLEEFQEQNRVKVK